MLIRGGIAVRELRKARGYSQQKLALEYGVGKNTIGNWETGKNEPPFIMVFEIGKYLGFSIEEIYGIVNNTQLQNHKGRSKRAA
jgi:DNA-binding XRE family transcriptional regulator